MTAEARAQRTCEACGAPLSVYNRETVCSGCARHVASGEEPADWLRRPEPVRPENSGAVIRAWRTAGGHSQAETAELLGMTQQNLSQIENGRQLMSYEQRQRAVATLGIPAVELGLSPGRPRAELDAVVAEDQERWRQERWWLKEHRSELGRLARQFYAEPTVPGTACLAKPGWVLDEPVGLRSLKLSLVEEPRTSGVDGREAETLPMRPLHASGRRFESYTSAMRHLDPPRLFESRTSYRLLREDLTAGDLEFGLASYFDKLDVSEAVSHELAVACIYRPGGIPSSVDAIRDELSFRALLGDPFNLERRAVLPGIATLTIRLRRHPAEPTFLLHWRDPTKVAAEGGQYGLIPAGEFQPASVNPWDRHNDLDIWRNIVREYSEELLGSPEHDGARSAPIDYDSWPLFRELEDAQASGAVVPFLLGIGMNALTLNAPILTVVVIDDDVFSRVFGGMVRYNEEGEVVGVGDGRAVEGIPFTHDAVQRLLGSEPLAGPGAACLALAWRHRDRLLG